MWTPLAVNRLGVCLRHVPFVCLFILHEVGLGGCVPCSVSLDLGGWWSVCASGLWVVLALLFWLVGLKHFPRITAVFGSAGFFENNKPIKPLGNWLLILPSSGFSGDKNLWVFLAIEPPNVPDFDPKKVDHSPHGRSWGTFRWPLWIGGPKWRAPWGYSLTF